MATVFLDALSMGILGFLSSQVLKCPVFLASVSLGLHNSQEVAVDLSSIIVYRQSSVLCGE